MRRGANLQVAYFDQMRDALDLDATLEDFISPGSEWIEIGSAAQARQELSGATSCSRRRARAAPVRSLSGGERNRLLLARLFARPANVLVLDEPTNDLDIDTLELLEDLLQNYEGTVFLVSHDRSFPRQRGDQHHRLRGRRPLARVRGRGAGLVDRNRAGPRRRTRRRRGPAPAHGGAAPKPGAPPTIDAAG